MIQQLKNYLAARRKAARDWQWRHGFLAGIDRRIFPHDAPIMDAVQLAKASDACRAGYKHGLRFEHIYSLPIVAEADRRKAVAA